MEQKITKPEYLIRVPGPILKGTIVRYKEGWQRVTAVFPKKGTCNIGPIFGGRGRFSGIKKGIPLTEVYEDDAAWYAYWQTTDQYKCM